VSLLFAGILIRLLLKKTGHNRALLSYAAFFCFLIPSVIIIFSESTVSFLAWRFLYLPSAVFVGSLVYFAMAKIRPRIIPLLFLSGLCLIYTAEIYPKNRNFGKSERDFWLGIKNVSRENPLARYNIALQHLTKDEDKAQKIFDSILTDRKHHLHGRFEERIYEELAAFYTFHEKLDKAEDYFNRLLSLREVQSQHFYVTYASFLALKGKQKEGESIIQEMLRLFPENHLILLHSAKFYIVLKDYSKAIDILTRDYELFPTQEVKELLASVRKIEEKSSNPSPEEK
jgi:tetratricopeptide (TPR) repeat protein